MRDITDRLLDLYIDNGTNHVQEAALEIQLLRELLRRAQHALPLSESELFMLIDRVLKKDK